VCRANSLIGKYKLAYSGFVPDIFHALDDETRRTVLDELVLRDGQTLFEICAVLTGRHGISTSRQGISQHLAVLEEAGLIRVQRRGRSKFHFITPDPLDEIVRRWPTTGEQP
jgi:DNA-binding transcriptional ArsR family regulator